MYCSEAERSKLDPQARLKKVNSVTKDVLEELDREYKPTQTEVKQLKKADKFNAVRTAEVTSARRLTMLSTCP